MSMIHLSDIEKIEIEITSHCNAACPGCARTLHPDSFELKNLDLLTIKKILPEGSIVGKLIKLCGVLGDPILNPECAEITEYLIDQGAKVNISTNGGYQTTSFWTKLGEISAKTGRLSINFAIDGFESTNHIYRVNTNFKVIERNVRAYMTAQGGNPIACWIYIVFDFNEHDLENARALAAELNMDFAVRTGMRNSYNNWIASIRRKDSKTKTMVTETKIISVSDKFEHADKTKVIALERISNSWAEKSEEEINAVVDSITCKFYHQKEIFISSTGQLWPCCFVWDSVVKNTNGINSVFNKFNTEWNSLFNNSVDEILMHPWYTEILQLSWNPNHNEHIKDCIVKCGMNQAYHNKITYDTK